MTPMIPDKWQGIPSAEWRTRFLPMHRGDPVACPTAKSHRIRGPNGVKGEFAWRDTISPNHRNTLQQIHKDQHWQFVLLNNPLISSFTLRLHPICQYGHCGVSEHRHSAGHDCPATLTDSIRMLVLHASFRWHCEFHLQRRSLWKRFNYH